MDDAANATQTSATSSVAAVAAAAQHQQLQRQLFLMQQAQAQAQAQPHPQAQQLSQQAMSRFPSNIDAHLRPLGPHRFQQPASAPSQLQTPPQPHSQGQPSPQQSAQARVRSPEVEMALQDAMRVCNPDIKTPFHSLEDAVSRLLPYHVVADYEAEEDDRILDSDATGQIPSRLQQWDHNILEEKQASMELRAEIESREKAGREAAEAKMRMAMVEHARVEAQPHPEVIGHGPLRANSAASQGDDGPSHDMAQEHVEDGWENTQRDDDDPSEDFLNDENEPDNGNSDMQEEWRRSGEFDLNSR
ncbi:cell division protein FtsZ 1 isoform X3 [Hordeum vulgare subsp. vulgare]|uniref:cell division protein FtsZ 1 isoform X3 n=1 Tax=Hordeum vulgare subsp. vulgare TaxID=112509 RepID=UPI001D1A32A6|nr:cell division protein FtsZ 1 isoform X3 [Hordeum vulgare subsp. vulgare]